MTAAVEAGLDRAAAEPSPIIDGHCHIWRRWPYQPPVPDPKSRALAGQLLYQMDQSGVDKAIVIAAALGGNTGNADYAFAEAAQNDRLIVFADLESRWSPEFRTIGAAARLKAALQRWPQMLGFTLYPTEEETGEWFLGPEGTAFFAVAEAAGLVASLSLMPHQFGVLAELARRYPGISFLLHHHGFLGPRSGTTVLDRALAEPLATHGNIWIKLSGLGNCAGPQDEYPYADLQWIGALLYQLIGADRLIWGSDFPVSSKHMTYRQTLEVFRRHGPGTAPEKAMILGGNLARILRLAP